MPIKTLTEKFIATRLKEPTKTASSQTFFELARKHIIKKGIGVSKNLSKNIDKILYGA